jgi:hypothetical protein
LRFRNIANNRHISQSWPLDQLSQSFDEICEAAPMEVTLITLGFLVGLPLLLIGWVAFSENCCWGTWLLKVLAVGSYCWLLFEFASWYLLSYYGRYLILALFVIAVIHSSRQIWGLPAWRSLSLKAWLSPISNAPTGSLLVLGIVLVNLVSGYRGYRVPTNPVNLTFPLKNGAYYIAQGGSHPTINGHMKVAEPGMEAWRGQLWSLDIVKLNAFGNRAKGIYPKQLDAYAIYGEPVYAPCDGTIAAVENRVPDLPPPTVVEGDSKAGNHVIVQCGPEAFVLLAHLQQGSIVVSPQQTVKSGDFLGKIGNSGNSAEPHLHIHAQQSAGDSTVADADPRPMVFDGDFLVRGQRLFTPHTPRTP